MYGKIFESLYRGSMIGAGAMVFAVWGYVISHMRRDAVVGAQVELNPKLLEAIIGEKEEKIREAIDYLCAPDPASTSKDEDGKRLVRMGQFAYRVVNGRKYMDMRNAEERREYQRNWVADKRAGGPKGRKRREPVISRLPGPGAGLAAAAESDPRLAARIEDEIEENKRELVEKNCPVLDNQ